MRVITNENDFRLPNSVVSIGMFDGVHRGHKRVLQSLRQLGQRRGVPTVLVTFDPHPRAVLRPDAAPAMLSTLDDRMSLLAATGAVDYCVVLPFDRQRSTESAADFVRATLVGRFGMRSLVVGENFACGRGRQGTVDYLREYGVELGYSVHPVEMRAPSDPLSPVPCSSSETRRLIQSGDIGRAAAMLDRPHEITCTVVATDQLGLHFVEVAVPGAICAPPAGHYAGFVRAGDASAPWVRAILQVRDGSRAYGRMVRLLTGIESGVAAGEAVTLRFMEQVGDTGRGMAGGALAAVA